MQIIIGNSIGVNRTSTLGGEFEYTAIDNNFSMEFDRAAGDYMTTGINIPTDSDITVSFWVKGNTKAGFFTPGIFPFGIGVGGNSTSGRIHADKFMIQSLDNDGVNFGNRIVDIDIYDGNWYHMVFTRSNATGQYFAYVNGINVQWTGYSGASSAPSITINPSGDLYIGTAGANTAYCFDGIIDEFAIWDVVLGDPTIEAIYNTTNDSDTGQVADLSETPEGVPLAWYRFE
ncbi:MAG: LamG domain-containing protein [Saprospiraceae bacterium]